MISALNKEHTRKHRAGGSQKVLPVANRGLIETDAGGGLNPIGLDSIVPARLIHSCTPFHHKCFAGLRAKQMADIPAYR